MDETKVHSIIPPTALTVFGATGNLAMRRILPALVHLDSEGLLPSEFKLLAVGQRQITTKEYIDMVAHSNLSEKSQKHLSKFADKIQYISANFDDPSSFAPISEALRRDDGHNRCYNRLYYFATAPQYFIPGANILKQAGLLTECSAHGRVTRIMIEKPYGFDLKSAKELNKTLAQYFEERQIYRLDHYLGKETVQNLMVMRFANDFLEPIWDKDHIDHVEISVLEKSTVGDRIKTYDTVGALKDVLQNHILQMLALTLMDQPKDLNPESIRDEKVKILQSLETFSKHSISGNVIRGQYASTGNMPGYVEEVGVDSKTETYLALKTHLKNSRYKGVPIYLRTGKGMTENSTEVSVHFKHSDKGLFKEQMTYSNVLTFRIQPNEEVRMQINNKVIGFGMMIHRGQLQFGYKDAFNDRIPDAYEKILLDFIDGDQRLFIRSDEIEAAWKFVDSIAENIDDNNSPLHQYKIGSQGPEQAQGLVPSGWWTK